MPFYLPAGFSKSKLLALGFLIAPLGFGCPDATYLPESDDDDDIDAEIDAEIDDVTGDGGSRPEGGGGQGMGGEGLNADGGQGAGTASSTQPCDDGSAGTVESEACTECVVCASDGACQASYEAYASHPDASPFDRCWNGCGDDSGCMDECASSFPEVLSLYDLWATCVVCSACPNNCGAAEYGC